MLVPSHEATDGRGAGNVVSVIGTSPALRTSPIIGPFNAIGSIDVHNGGDAGFLQAVG